MVPDIERGIDIADVTMKQFIINVFCVCVCGRFSVDEDEKAKKLCQF